MVALIVIVLFGSFFFSKAADPEELVPEFPPVEIEAVSNPEFGVVPWPPGDPVMGVELGSDTRTYPISLLEWHGALNDHMGGLDIAVTYSFLSDSGVVYNRELDGKTLTFDVHGGIYKNNLILRDRETQTLWSQLTGKALKGPLQGKTLSTIASIRTDWADWETLHPSTVVLRPPRNLDYGIHPYGDYRTNDAILFPHRFENPALDPKELVLGIGLNGSYSAYPLSSLSGERVVMDDIGSARVVIAHTSGAAFVYDAQNRSFTYVSTSVMASQDGHNWSMGTGLREDGNGSLISLQSEAVVCYWFAWLNFHPETSLYGYASSQTTERSPLDSALPWLVGLLLCAVVVLYERYSHTNGSKPLKWIAFRFSLFFAALAFLASGVVGLDAVGNLQGTTIALGVLFAGLFFTFGVLMAHEWWRLRGFESAEVPLDRAEFEANLERVFALEEITVGPTDVVKMGFVAMDGGFGLSDPKVQLLFSGDWMFVGNSDGYSAQDVSKAKRMVELALTPPEEELV